MNKEEFLELAQLYLLNELSDDQAKLFESELNKSLEWRAEFNSLKNLFEDFTRAAPGKCSDELLSSARNNLNYNIRREYSKERVGEKTRSWLSNFFLFNYKLALGGAAMLFIGFALSYLIFGSNYQDKPIIEASRTINVDDFGKGDIKYSNIKIPTNITGGNEIEISFDAIKPINYKASADDPLIRHLLASSLVTEKNPGIRLRTLNAITSQLEVPTFSEDPKIKAALITALKVDGNPAVRKEALTALLKFKFDSETRDALLFVLSNDRNSGLRVASINALAQMKIEGVSLDEKIINVLNRKAANDESDFIKLRAASLVKEVN